MYERMSKPEGLGCGLSSARASSSGVARERVKEPAVPPIFIKYILGVTGAVSAGDDDHSTSVRDLCIDAMVHEIMIHGY